MQMVLHSSLMHIFFNFVDIRHDATCEQTCNMHRIVAHYRCVRASPRRPVLEIVWHAEWYASGIKLSVACMIGLADVTRYVNVRVFTRRHLQ